jgi:hypothetical protein
VEGGRLAGEFVAPEEQARPASAPSPSIDATSMRKSGQPLGAGKRSSPRR